MTADKTLENWLYVRELTLSRVESSLVLMTERRMATMQTLIAQEIIEADSNGDNRLSTLLSQINAIIDASYDDLTEETSTEIAELAVLETSNTTEAMIEAVELEQVAAEEDGSPGRKKEIAAALLILYLMRDKQPKLAVDKVGKAQIDGHTATALRNEQKRALKWKLAGLLRVGKAQDQKASEIAEAVTGTKAMGRKDSVLNVNKAHAKTLVRTTMAVVVNNARQAVMDKVPMIKFYDHESILDGKTSQICIKRAFKRWTKDKKPVGHSVPFRVPPLHPNCRSRIKPIMSTKPEPAQDIQEWMLAQDEDTQRDLLGKWRSEALREGKLKISDITNMNDRPLTIEQLKTIK